MRTFVDKWLQREPFESVRMGGISIGYEEAIQSLAATSMAAMIQRGIEVITEENSKEATTIVDEKVHELNERYGYSGAQVGAAKNMISVIATHGYEKAIQIMKDSDPSRIILIQNGLIINWKEE